MSLIFANRVHEACSASGVQNLTLLGALSGKATFSSKIATGYKVPYVLLDGNGVDWEIGYGTLASASELQRTTIIDSSASTGRINSDEAGTPIKLSLSTNQHEVFCAPNAGNVFAKDENGDLADPSAIRASLFVDTFADMTALLGLEDGETVFVRGGSALGDGLGGCYRWDAADAGAEATPESFEHDSIATGLFKKVRFDFQGIVQNGVVEVDAAVADTTGGSIYAFFRKKLTLATAWARWHAFYASGAAAFKLGIRHLQSAAEKFFVAAVSTGDNFDRVELLEPVVLPTRTNANGLKSNSLAWLSGVSQLALARADAAASGSPADYYDVPLTKGGYLVGVYETVTALKAIDAAAVFRDGDKARVLGNAALGDCPDFTVKWVAASSATADDATVFRPSTGAASTGDGRWVRTNSLASITFTGGDATPSVKNGAFYITAGTTNISDFDDGFEGQNIVVERGASDITIEHDVLKINNGGVNITLTAYAPRAEYTLVNGIWKLIAHSNPGLNPDLTNGVPRLLSAWFADCVNVMAFGVDNTGATDNATQLAQAFSAAATKVKNIYFPAGAYRTDTQLTIPNGCDVCGDGFAATSITSGSGTAGILLVPNSSIGTQVRHLKLTRSVAATADTATGLEFIRSGVCERVGCENLQIENQYDGLMLGPASFGWARNIICLNNYRDGIRLVSSATRGELQWQLTDCLSQKNDGAGYRVDSSAFTGNTTLGEWNRCHTFANTQGGYRFEGASGKTIQGVRMSNCFGGEDGDDILYMNTYGTYPNFIRGCSFELAGRSATGRNVATSSSGNGCGAAVTANNGFTSFANCNSNNNSEQGIDLDVLGHVTLSTLYDNGLNTGLTTNERCGVRMSAGGMVLGCNIYANSSVKQQVGVVWDTSNAVSIEFNRFNGHNSAATSGTKDSTTKIFGNTGLVDWLQSLQIQQKEVSYVLQQSGVKVDLTGTTTETVMATIAIPAGAIGPNGAIEVTSLWSMPGSTNNKIMRTRLGGTGIDGTPFGNPTINTNTTLSHRDYRLIQNRNAQNAQICNAAGGTFGFGPVAAAVTTGTVDTSAAVNLYITGQLGSSGETLSLESYLVRVHYGG